MTDKIKEIADEVRAIKFAFIGKDREKVARLEVLALKIEALNESSEIARLRGIIERAKIAKKNLEVEWEYRTGQQYNALSERSIEINAMLGLLDSILSEAEEQ